MSFFKPPIRVKEPRESTHGRFFTKNDWIDTLMEYLTRFYTRKSGII